MLRTPFTADSRTENMEGEKGMGLSVFFPFAFLMSSYMHMGTLDTRLDTMNIREKTVYI